MCVDLTFNSLYPGALWSGVLQMLDQMSLTHNIFPFIEIVALLSTSNTKQPIQGLQFSQPRHPSHPGAEQQIALVLTFQKLF